MDDPPIRRLLDCRSLERRLLNASLPLEGIDQVGTFDIPIDHKADVERVMKQFARENLPDYLKSVQAPGNREPHYRDRHIEATLVCDWRGWSPQFVGDFRAAVDKALPYTYAWFNPSSLHLTVRGLA